MMARLLYSDQDFDLESRLPWNAEALARDLSLDTLFTAMSGGDKFIAEVSGRLLLSSLDNELETIRFRQGVLQDCLNEPAVVRELYVVSIEAIEGIRKSYYYFGTLERHPGWSLRSSIELIEALLDVIKKLRAITDAHADRFVSEGWSRFFEMLKRELSDEYLIGMQHHLEQLKFGNGVLFSAQLSDGNKGSRYVLHRPPPREAGWLMRWLAPRKPVFSFSIHPRDEAGARALTELQDRGISLVANALAQSADHVRSFFGMLRTELAFYVGCVNLHEKLVREGKPACLPSPADVEDRRLSFKGLYDVCLALSVDQRVVGNEADADDRDLVIVTGANQGGKSTFLRSVGLAQLMMQCGMFAPAESFRSSLADGLYTHFKREEDPNMESGKLDEELSRMSDIVDHISSHPLILFNESFSATNEREGSEIARQILSALLDNRTRMIFVTHLYELAHEFHERNTEEIMFLRAERREGGARTFKLIEGEPLKTSFGEDLYRTIFSAAPDHSGGNGPEAREGAL